MQNAISLKPLVDIKDANDKIVLEIRYATVNNFTKKNIYKTDVCYIHEDVAISLNKVQKHLEKQNLGLKIFDGYRPIWAQQILFDVLPDERYVGNPKKITRHTRGTAVDVTLINLVDKTELAMPTGFDSFEKKAHLDFEDLSDEIKKNRKLLQDVMINIGGFEPLPNEWWHFDFKNWQNYPVLKIELR